MRNAVRTAAWILLASIVAPGAAAGFSLVQNVATAPASMAPPATLAAGTHGSTTLGASATSAQTTYSTIFTTSRHVLNVENTDGVSWDVHLELVSTTGFGLLDSATVSIQQGGNSVTQISVVLGSVTQTLGDPLGLPDPGGEVQIRVASTKSSLTPNTFTMDIVLTPPGEPAPELRYRYTLTQN